VEERSGTAAIYSDLPKFADGRDFESNSLGKVALVEAVEANCPRQQAASEESIRILCAQIIRRKRGEFDTRLVELVGQLAGYFEEAARSCNVELVRSTADRLPS
jgi:hypothetical protein